MSIYNLEGKPIDSFSDMAKDALLNCMRNLYWRNSTAKNDYEVLEKALSPDVFPKIVAEYNPGASVIYTDDNLDTLKQYLIVKYYPTRVSSGVVLNNDEYLLSGVLRSGTSMIIVSYQDVATIFSTHVIDFYNISHWIMRDNITILSAGGETSLTDEASYPSRIAFYNNAKRRTFVTKKGKAPFYEWEKTAVPTIYYPIPIPSNANHVKITTLPNTQNVYFHTIQYLADYNKYGNSIVNNRLSWVELDSNGVVEKDIENPGNLFAVINLRYDSSNTVYPSDPTHFEIEFSEV